jgi:hypothetical protein
VLPLFDEHDVKLLRVLTDRGVERQGRLGLAAPNTTANNAVARPRRHSAWSSQAFDLLVEAQILASMGR